MELRTATFVDRSTIHRVRHEVYATELGQHAPVSAGRLTDPHEEANEYLVAAHGAELIGFISITPPWAGRYSVDKYLDRADWPQLADGDPTGLFEVRLLTVRQSWRGSRAAALLMYAAQRWVAGHGGRRIVAIGRVEVLKLYVRAGLRPLGFRFHSGAVAFELLAARGADLEARAVRYLPLLRPAITRWRLELPMVASETAFHGGAAFEAIGPRFDTLATRSRGAPACGWTRRISNTPAADRWNALPPAPPASSCASRCPRCTR